MWKTKVVFYLHRCFSKFVFVMFASSQINHVLPKAEFENENCR